MNSQVLVTGFTGNVGSFAARHLNSLGISVKAAVRDINKCRELYGSDYDYVPFDFEEDRTYTKALQGVNKIFLIRPPAISEPKKIFPLIDAAKQNDIEHIVFLSLMGIENNPIPPHYKIEQYIKASGIPYTFLRPGFFMQNLDTTHRADIKERNEIFIPAGKALVSFIDVRDIGEAAAVVLANEGHLNKAYTLTGGELLDYAQVARILSNVLKREIRYMNPSPWKFRKSMIERGMAPEFVNVMLALYISTRFGMAKKITSDLEFLLKRRPTTFEQYAISYAHCWL